MKFGILTCTSTVDGGDGHPRATLAFRSKEGLGQFREWIDDHVMVEAQELAKRRFITRYQLFKALIRGRLE